MNTLVLTCLLWFVVCSAVGAQKPEATNSSALTAVTAGPASGDGLQGSLSVDDEQELDGEVSGGDHENFIVYELNPIKDEKKKKKGKGKKKNKQRNKSTTPLNPAHHTGFTDGNTTSLSTTENPCTSSFLGYCIHGYCKSIEGLREPVCICMKGYDGERCGIQTLETIRPRSNPGGNSELVQTILVIIAVVLSVISCSAILLMTCAHYRSHKNFMASYLGTGAEQEKLQKAVEGSCINRRQDKEEKRPNNGLDAFTIRRS